jgi:hypothetical protein
MVNEINFHFVLLNETVSSPFQPFDSPIELCTLLSFQGASFDYEKGMHSFCKERRSRPFLKLKYILFTSQRF